MIPRGIKHQVRLGAGYTGHGRNGVFNPARHVACHGAARGGQGHVDGDVAVIVDIHLIDEAQLLDINGNFPVVDGLEG